MSTEGTSELAALLDRLARTGSVDRPGVLSVVPQRSARYGAVLAFTGHSVIAADVAPDWVYAQLPDADLAAPMRPSFLAALGHHLGRRATTIDMLTVADPRPGPPPRPVVEAAGTDHPRVRRAARYRDDVRVWACDGGVVVLGRGLAGRWEVGIEVDEEHRGRGLGRRLAEAARHLVPSDRLLWAQITPGNATSVRTFLAAGFRPVGAESLLVTH